MAIDHRSLVRSIKVLVVVMAFITAAQGTLAQGTNRWETDGLCRRLKHVERISGRKLENAFSDRRSRLHHVSLALNERRDVLACCDGLSSSEMVTTGRAAEPKMNISSRSSMSRKRPLERCVQSEESSLMTTKMLIGGWKSPSIETGTRK